MGTNNTVSLKELLNNATSDTHIIGTFILALLISIIGVIVNQPFFNAIMVILSGFCLGYSVYRYTKKFENNTEMENLGKNLAEDLFTLVKGIIENIEKSEPTQNDENSIRELCKIIKSLDKYHSIDLEALRGRRYKKIEEGKAFYRTNPLSTFNEAPIEMLDKVFYYMGDAKETANSGSNWRLDFEKIKQENANRFGGSGSNEQVFKQDS